MDAVPITVESPAVYESHPPYSHMIIDAIGCLNEQNGSSKRSIEKYILDTYSVFPTSHSALLTHHIKQLRVRGEIRMVKLSYKLPEPTHATPVPKYGPPRPKVTDLSGTKTSPGQSTKLKDLELNPDTSKRGPGRPPKSKERRGRPRKDHRAVESVITKAFSVKRPGRPRKFGAGSMGRSPGRPKKFVSRLLELSPGVGSIGRSPGRPRKNIGSPEVPLAVHLRGQNEFPNHDDLKIKLQHFQSKVKQSLDVLKPLHTSERHTSPALAAALLDLEELSTLDIESPTW